MKKLLHRHYNITVKGNVQRVRYRVCAQAKAASLNLTGLVKNLHNGDVYIEVEGKEENVHAFIDWCYVGSPLSKVIEVISEEASVKELQTFELKR